MESVSWLVRNGNSRLFICIYSFRTNVDDELEIGNILNM